MEGKQKFGFLVKRHCETEAQKNSLKSFKNFLKCKRLENNELN